MKYPQLQVLFVRHVFNFSLIHLYLLYLIVQDIIKLIKTLIIPAKHLVQCVQIHRYILGSDNVIIPTISIYPQ